MILQSCYCNLISEHLTVNIEEYLIAISEHFHGLNVILIPSFYVDL